MIHGTMTTSSKKDYLSILGLSPDFDDKELKKAFRREARKWHPDLNKNDLNAEERFKLINQAYEYLRNPNIRKNISDENFPNEIDIRGEVFIQNNDFENLKDKFANARNAASGSLRQKNPQDTKKIPLKFIAYTFGYEKGLNVNCQTDFIKKLMSFLIKSV